MAITDGRHLADAEFPPAPLSALGRIARLVTLSLLGMALVGLTTLSLLQPPRVPWHVPVLLAVAVPGYLFAWFWNRLLRYRLADGSLRIERRSRSRALPLAGLQSAAADPRALHGAWKFNGQKSPGAISGRFYSRRLGRFEAFATDGAHAVVLRWANRCVVISPDQPERFVEAIRRHAGLGD